MMGQILFPSSSNGTQMSSARPEAYTSLDVLLACLEATRPPCGRSCGRNLVCARGSLQRRSLSGQILNADGPGCESYIITCRMSWCVGVAWGAHAAHQRACRWQKQECAIFDVQAVRRRRIIRPAFRPLSPHGRCAARAAPLGRHRLQPLATCPTYDHDRLGHNNSAGITGLTYWLEFTKSGPNLDGWVLKWSGTIFGHVPSIWNNHRGLSATGGGGP
jgi:hypothetical protein